MSCLVFSLLAIGPARAGEGAHWGYEGETGPEHWADLSPDFVLCRHGANQSPVDIRDTIEAELPPIELNYRSRGSSVVNNGHTLQIDVEKGSWLEAEGDRFQLVQFHFHSPSEHLFRGQSFPLEAHFVHQNAAGQLAVIAVMFRLGEEHADLRRIGKLAPREVGQSSLIDLDLDFDLSKMTIHRAHRSYFRYTGSLTTPPCSEGVRWFVLKTVSHVSQAQVANFVGLIGEDARGPQPQNARLILEH